MNIGNEIRRVMRRWKPIGQHRPPVVYQPDAIEASRRLRGNAAYLKGPAVRANPSYSGNRTPHGRLSPFQEVPTTGSDASHLATPKRHRKTLDVIADRLCPGDGADTLRLRGFQQAGCKQSRMRPPARWNLHAEGERQPHPLWPDSGLTEFRRDNKAFALCAADALLPDAHFHRDQGVEPNNLACVLCHGIDSLAEGILSYQYNQSPSLAGSRVRDVRSAYN